MIFNIRTNVHEFNKVLPRIINKAIPKLQQEISYELAKEGAKAAKLEAMRFRWRGHLADNISYARLSRKKGSHAARVFIRGEKENRVGLRNEMGVDKPEYYAGSRIPSLLKEWMDEHGFGGRAKITIGGKGTHLGRQNVFWKPAFIAINKKVPIVAERLLKYYVGKEYCKIKDNNVK